jgi:DNA-binding NarL/FixJ family response regulator
MACETTPPHAPSIAARQGGTQTTIALISGHHLLRLGLQESVKSEAWIRLVQPTATSINVDDLIAQENPHIIIVDSQTKSDLRALVQRIRGSAPEIKIILLCDMDQAEHSRQTLGACIDSIVLNVQPAQVLFATIKHRMDIPQYATRQMGTANINASTTRATVPALGQSQHGKEAGLSERERQVVKLVGEGLTNKEIAACLHIADSTVRHHLTSIFDKLGVSNRQNLLIRARRHGIE